MEETMAHDIAALEAKVRGLEKQVSKLHDAKHSEALIGIIRRPGFTTPRESEFVSAHLDILHSQATSLHSAYETLVKIAEKIAPK
jgi:hypothetical protein